MQFDQLPLLHRPPPPPPAGEEDGPPGRRRKRGSRKKRRDRPASPADPLLEAHHRRRKRARKEARREARRRTGRASPVEEGAPDHAGGADEKKAEAEKAGGDAGREPAPPRAPGRERTGGPHGELLDELFGGPARR